MTRHHGEDNIRGIHFDDLTAYNYGLSKPLNDVYCIGWLDFTQPYPMGELSDRIIRKLESIILRRDDRFDAHANVERGYRLCEACGQQVFMDAPQRRYLLGCSEIWIPNDSGWLAAPSLIYHCITGHKYLPPPSFIQAVDILDMNVPYSAQSVYDRVARRPVDL